jgi:hypothetical protein
MSSVRRDRGRLGQRRCPHGLVRQERLGKRLWVTRTPSVGRAFRGVEHHRWSPWCGRRRQALSWPERAVRAENREAALGTLAQLDTLVSVLLGGPAAARLSTTKHASGRGFATRRARPLPIC